MRDSDVILEVPAEWFDNLLDGPRHQRLYASLLTALADLSVTLRPVRLPCAADTAPRLHRPGQLVLSFHSHGAGGNVLRIKEAYWPPYYSLDPEGFSGFSRLARDGADPRAEIAALPLGRARAFVAGLRETAMRDNLSKYPQPTGPADLPPGRYVFLPLQMAGDPVTGLSRLDPLDAIARTALEVGRTGRRAVVKRHPLCRSAALAGRLRDLARDLPNLHVTDASVHPLIAGADAVVGCNSGVLFEGLIHGTPVISYGESDFRIATVAVNSLSGLSAALSGPLDWDADFATRFVTWYLTRYCVHAGDVAGLRGRIAQALDTLDIDPRDINEEQLELYRLHACAARDRRQGAF